MRTIRFRRGLAMPLLVTLIAAPLAAQAPQAQPAPTATAKLPPAREIIDRHIKAIGGRDMLMAYKSTRTTGTVSIPAAGLTGALEAFAAKPDKLVTRTTLPGVGELLEGFNGVHGWSVSPLTGPSLLQGKQLEQKKFDADFLSELKPAERYKSITTIEETVFEGRPCYKIKFVRQNGDEEFELYDVATGLKAGIIVTRETEMGTVTVTNALGEYKKFGNLLAATRAKQSMMGLQTVITVTTIEYDTVDSAVFDPPAQIRALIK